MDEKNKDISWCPICGGQDFVKLIRGYEGNPIKVLKCSQCGREFPETVPCDDETCKI